MMSLVFVIGLVAACSASPSLYFSGPQYYSGYYPASVVTPIKSQYHTQNELGQYAYGYNDGFSSKSETKHANGLTEGAYSYVDPNGVLQQYRYVSDENGYRVSGTNLPVAPAVPAVAVAPAAVPVASVAPAAADVADVAVSVENAELPQPVQDTPEVAAAKAAHQVAYDEAKKAADASPDDDSSATVVEVPAAVEAAPAVPAVPAVKIAAPAVKIAAPAVSYSYPSPVYAAYPYATAAAPAYAAPVYAAPAYAATPYVQYSGAYSSPVHSQYHAQDEFGQYSYGYSGAQSSKNEIKTLDGVTRGGYSYVDANGIVQQYQYVSDPINGFRVSGTNLPSNSL